MDMQNAAKVFGEGDVTIVINRVTTSARVYVGTQQISLLQKIKLDLDFSKPSPQLEFSFPQTHDKETSLRIEEQVRAVKQCIPWAQVTR